jgi:hypothetical protein
VSNGKSNTVNTWLRGLHPFAGKDDDELDPDGCNIIGEAWMTNLSRYNHLTDDLAWFIFEQVVLFAKAIAPDLVSWNRMLKLPNRASRTRAAVITEVSLPPSTLRLRLSETY